MRPIPSSRRARRSRDRAGVENDSPLTPAGPETRREWDNQINDLTNRMLAFEHRNRDFAQAVAAQDALLDGYRRGCKQIVDKIESLDAYAQAFLSFCKLYASYVRYACTVEPLTTRPSYADSSPSFKQWQINEGTTLVGLRMIDG